MRGPPDNRGASSCRRQRRRRGHFPPRSRAARTDGRLRPNAGGNCTTSPTCRGRGLQLAQARHSGQPAQVSWRCQPAQASWSGQRRETLAEPHRNCGSTTSQEEQPTRAKLNSQNDKKVQTGMVKHKPNSLLRPGSNGLTVKRTQTRSGSPIVAANFNNRQHVKTVLYC